MNTDNDLTLRVGKFSLPRDMLSKEPQAVYKIMGQCMIVRAECMFCDDRIEYIAISHRFRPVTVGERAPEYYWNITRECDGVSTTIVVEPFEAST